MSIPFISNVAFTEVDSEGVLNDKAGTTKSKLPIQIFKLTDNITGNLTLNSNAIHKKIILDTNGKTIISNTGSPLTINSSIPLEIKGSGNIQSHDLTFASAESNTSYTGTTTIADADNSTMIVTATTTDTTTTTALDRTLVSGGDSFGSTTGVSYVSWNSSDVPAVFQNAFANPGDRGGGNFTNGSLFIGSTSQSTSTAPSGNTIGLRTTGCGAQISLVTAGVPHIHSTPVYFQNCVSGNPYQWIYYNQGGGGVGTAVRLWMRLPSTQNNRVLTYTNNLAISVTLTGNAPFNDVEVAAGGNSPQTRSNSTDGSFNILGTITGSNGSGEPYALKPVNNGSQSSLVTTAYTGTFSVSAF